MEAKAGIFTEPSTGKWVWEGNELFDTRGKVVAEVRTDVIYIGADRLLVEYSPGPFRFRVRATNGDGSIFTLTQSGYTVSKLVANCAGRRYVLERSSVWRKERRIFDARGDVAVTVRPLASGKVEVLDGPVQAKLPTMDAVFLTWGCVLVDSPVRRPRLA